MGEPKPDTTTTTTTTTNDSDDTSSTPPPPPPKPIISLLKPSAKKKHRAKPFRVLRSLFRSFPILSPACKLPSLSGGLGLPELAHRGNTGIQITGTLFGYRKGRVSLSMQENPRTLPMLVVELAMQTHALQKEMSVGMVRIALECEKRPDRQERSKMKLLEEPIWTMYCHGKKMGYGVKREANDEDLHVMELLKAVSMGAGVLPGSVDYVEGPDDELAYVRAHFEHVVGSKDSETLYMLNPDGSRNNNGPELSIFFVSI